MDGLELTDCNDGLEFDRLQGGIRVWLMARIDQSLTECKGGLEFGYCKGDLEFDWQGWIRV